MSTTSSMNGRADPLIAIEIDRIQVQLRINGEQTHIHKIQASIGPDIHFLWAGMPLATQYGDAFIFLLGYCISP